MSTRLIFPLAICLVAVIAATANPASPEAKKATDQSCTVADQAAPNGLRGSLRALKNEVAAGDDILVKFEIALTDDALGPIHVWDSKFSEGYRSWMFEVTTPSARSKRQVLRRPVQESWDKNAPHPVAIVDGKPYILHGWGIQHGVWKGTDYYFSLKRLGMDTSPPGKYVVTGIFTQPGGTFATLRGASPAKSGSVCLWGGKVATPAISISVK